MKRKIEILKRAFLCESGYAIIISIIFLVFGTVLSLHHEMWRDEVNVWLIARDFSSPIEILQHLRYDGHPGLWHLSVFAIRHIFPSLIAMQILHLIIASASIYLFARYSPFTRLQKALLAFGYFFFYEYAVLCRNYALGIFLLFLVCVLFPKRFNKLPLLGFILFLAAHTSFHALIVVISIGLALFVEYISSKEKRLETNKFQLGIGFFLISLGIVTSILQLKPPPDYGFAVEWTTKFDIGHLRDVLNIVSRMFVPIQQFDMHFWGSNILNKLPGAKMIHLVLSISILLWIIILLLRKPIALLIYVSGTMALLVFFYVKYFAGMRHGGFLFILFLVSIWIEGYYRDIKILEPLNRISLIFRRHMSVVLTVILVIHLVAGVIAAQFDYRFAFSEAKATARFM